MREFFCFFFIDYSIFVFTHNPFDSAIKILLKDVFYVGRVFNAITNNLGRDIATTMYTIKINEL